jgi:hypothetical protein
MKEYELQNCKIRSCFLFMFCLTINNYFFSSLINLLINDFLMIINCLLNIIQMNNDECSKIFIKT